MPSSLSVTLRISFILAISTFQNYIMWYYACRLVAVRKHVDNLGISSW